MERICSHCHATLKLELEADWCPACGGALLLRPAIPTLPSQNVPPSGIDHRGIELPRRHAVGGIITPQ